MRISSFRDLASIIFTELGELIACHKGLEVFAVKRAKFEGWVKVEIIRILKRYFNRVVPEVDSIDVVADDWAIELKTVNTSYRYPGVQAITRSITSNIKGIIKDIEKLKNSNYPNKIVLFIVFPLPDESLEQWEYHLVKIRSKVREIQSYKTTFRNGIPLRIYLGHV